MNSNPLRITAAPQSVTLTWRTFEGQLELKLLITLIVGAPVIALLLLGLFRQTTAVGMSCVGIIAVFGILIWLLVAGTTELQLDERGITRTLRKPLGVRSVHTTTGPLVVRISPLLGTSERPGGPPAQYMVVVLSATGFTPIDNMVVTASDVAAIREALVRADIPRLVIESDVQIEDDARPECRQCGYDLVGTSSANCPECGEPLTPGHQRHLAHLHNVRSGKA